MHKLLYNCNNVSININSYMFRASLAHHQGVNSCIIQPLDLIIISNTWNGRRFINVWVIGMDMCTEFGTAGRCVCLCVLLSTLLSDILCIKSFVSSYWIETILPDLFGYWNMTCPLCVYFVTLRRKHKNKDKNDVNFSLFTL